MRKLNIGLTEKEREGVIGLLNSSLSNVYLLLIKTKKYHWDVVGPQFRTLHMLLDEQYQALSTATDSIAERVRILGGFPAGTAAEFIQLASLEEHPGVIPNATEMVAKLVDDHEIIIRSLREQIDQSSEEFHDEGTADFLTGLMEQHEEMAWMLRSFIEGESVAPDGNLPQATKKVPASAGKN
ncbi:Dps family protein [Leptolyngbyaceae cyanobacterium UHCC 1019]